jgi:hypothetical protein
MSYFGVEDVFTRFSKTHWVQRSIHRQSGFGLVFTWLTFYVWSRHMFIVGLQLPQPSHLTAAEQAGLAMS